MIYAIYIMVGFTLREVYVKIRSTFEFDENEIFILIIKLGCSRMLLKKVNILSNPNEIFQFLHNT